MKIILKLRDGDIVLRNDGTVVNKPIITNIPLDDSLESKFYLDLLKVSPTDETEAYYKFLTQAHNTGTLTPYDEKAHNGWFERKEAKNTGHYYNVYHRPTITNVEPLTEGQRMWLSPAFLLALAPMLDFPVIFKGLNSKILTNGIERSVGLNGKIRFSLPSHTQSSPRQLVLEPAGNNKFRPHIRIWDPGHVPGTITNLDKNLLYLTMYDALPNGTELLFPETAPGFYGTRGTVAGLLRLGRDPRFIRGTQGTLLYVDKDGTIKSFEGTSFIKTPQRVKKSYTSPLLTINPVSGQISTGNTIEISPEELYKFLELQEGYYFYGHGTGGVDWNIDDPVLTKALKSSGKEGVNYVLDDTGYFTTKSPSFRYLRTDGNTEVYINPRALLIKNLNTSLKEAFNKEADALLQEYNSLSESAKTQRAAEYNTKSAALLHKYGINSVKYYNRSPVEGNGVSWFVTDPSVIYTPPSFKIPLLDISSVNNVTKRIYSTPKINITPVEGSITTSDIPNITPENAANITPEQWTAALDAAIAKALHISPEAAASLTKQQWDDAVAKGISTEEILRLRDLSSDTRSGVLDNRVFAHSTPYKFTVFDKSYFGRTDEGFNGKGFYFTNTWIPENPTPSQTLMAGPHGEKPFMNYGKNKMYVYLKGDREFGVGDPNRNFFDEPNTVGITSKHLYDRNKGVEVIVGNPKHIKLADAVTFDDDGVRIGLGDRDNFSNPDIRWGLLPWIFGGTVGISGYNYLNSSENLSKNLL